MHCLKMVCTVPKDPDDRGMMHVHDFNFGREQTFFIDREIFLIFERGKVSKNNNKQYQEVKCAEQCP